MVHPGQRYTTQGISKSKGLSEFNNFPQKGDVNLPEDEYTDNPTENQLGVAEATWQDVDDENVGDDLIEEETHKGR